MSSGAGRSLCYSILLRGGNGGVDGGYKVVVFPGAVEARVVDEKGWRAVDATADSAGKIGVNFGGEFAFFQGSAQVTWIEI